MPWYELAGWRFDRKFLVLNLCHMWVKTFQCGVLKRDKYKKVFFKQLELILKNREQQQGWIHVSFTDDQTRQIVSAKRTIEKNLRCEMWDIWEDRQNVVVEIFSPKVHLKFPSLLLILLVQVVENIVKHEIITIFVLRLKRDQEPAATRIIDKLNISISPYFQLTAADVVVLFSPLEKRPPQNAE